VACPARPAGEDDWPRAAVPALVVTEQEQLAVQEQKQLAMQ